MRFSEQRLAQFTVSFGAADTSRCDLYGDEGRLRLDPAFSHSNDLVLETQIGKRKTRRVFKKRDQVAAEIAHFAEHLQGGTEPSSTGLEGLADVRIIAALNESIASGRPSSSIRCGPNADPAHVRNVRSALIRSRHSFMRTSREHINRWRYCPNGAFRTARMWLARARSSEPRGTRRAVVQGMTTAGTAKRGMTATTDDAQHSREIAERAREQSWQGSSFLRELFLGRLREDLLPVTQNASERAEFRDFCKALQTFLRDEVDPAATMEL